MDVNSVEVERTRFSIREFTIGVCDRGMSLE